MEGTKKTFRWSILVESATWIIMILVIFGFRFLPADPIGDDITLIMVGVIISFVLLYYFIITKYLQHNESAYLKIIADIILIGVLIYILKDYGQYMFALYFLPIAAAALSLEFINALVIATIACLFVGFQIILGSRGLLPTTTDVFQGFWQIGLILFITIFCRALALQLRQERQKKEESIARQKLLEEEAKRQKEFLSLTSHQLFTPLSIIRGFASILHDGSMGKLQPRQEKAVSEIYANSKRVVNLVSELLSLSRLETGTFEVARKPQQIDELIHNIIDQFKETTHQEKLEFVFSPPKTEKIPIDSNKIRSCLYSLLDNAIKYSKEGKIEVRLAQDSAWTTVSVSDEGVGFKPEDKEKLFQPFFRGDNILELDNQGTGLGLYISRLIIEKHGGAIWAEKNKTKGATFTFRLPNKISD